MPATEAPTMPKPKPRLVSVKIPEDIHRKVKALATDAGRNFEDVLADYLRQPVARDFTRMLRRQLEEEGKAGQ